MLGEQRMKKWMFSFVVVASLLTACGTGNKSEETGATNTTNSEATTLTVKDSNGEVEVTKNPQKVVVFDNGSLDTLDALGVGDHVVGAATQNLPAYLSSYKEVESAGGIKEPDLEKINQMKPDLIIISGRQSDFQEELSKIAPTLFLSVDTEKPWESIQQNVLTLGEIFDKESEAKKQIKELSTEIEKTADKASELDKKALVVLVNEGQLSAYGSGSRFGLVHDVFGFPQADEAIEPSTHGQSVSFEYVLEKNPDLLFVIDRTKAIGGDDSRNNLAENELIAQTNAGKNGKIISLQPDVWYLSGGGLESMKVMLDDVNQAFE